MKDYSWAISWNQSGSITAASEEEALGKLTKPGDTWVLRGPEEYVVSSSVRDVRPYVLFLAEYPKID